MAGSTLRRSAGDDTVRVVGLAEFQRKLRQTSETLPGELRATHLKVAALVAAHAHARAQALGGVAAHVAPSIRAAAEQRFAKLTFGGAKYPMAFGANFGALHDKERQTLRGVMLGWNQFPPAVKPDRFIYATVRDDAALTMAAYVAALDALFRHAFPN